MRTIDNRLIALPLDPIAAHAGHVADRRFSDRYFTDPRLTRPRNRFPTNTVVNHRVVIADDVIVDDGGVAVKVLHTSMRHDIAIRSVVAEVIDVYE